MNPSCWFCGHFAVEQRLSSPELNTAGKSLWSYWLCRRCWRQLQAMRERLGADMSTWWVGPMEPEPLATRTCAFCKRDMTAIDDVGRCVSCRELDQGGGTAERREAKRTGTWGA